MRSNADLNTAVQNYSFFHVILEQFLISDGFVEFLCPIQSKVSTTEKRLKNARKKKRFLYAA